MAKSKKRTVVLTDDPKKNVSVFACRRLNNAVKSIQTLGNCFGDKYDWTPEQIETVKAELQSALDATIQNITNGKKVASVGITL